MSHLLDSSSAGPELVFDGHLIIRSALDAQKWSRAARVTGNVEVRSGVPFDTDSLREVGGSVVVQGEDSVFSAPNLESVAGQCLVRDRGVASLGALTIGDRVYAGSRVMLPRCRRVGEVEVASDGHLAAPELRQVDTFVRIATGAPFYSPLLAHHFADELEKKAQALLAQAASLRGKGAVSAQRKLDSGPVGAADAGAAPTRRRPRP